MQNGRRIVCVLPAYNAARTLERTVKGVTPDTVDRFILVDDCSRDATVQVAQGLAQDYPVRIIHHSQTLGYGANQKTCYRAALEEGAEVVVMLHPDYQYEPRLLGVLAGLVSSGVYDVALGSRILGRGALAGGMPLYKYAANRVLTLLENLLLGQKLSEYHTGYRAYSRRALESVPFERNSDDFVFDNEILVQLHLAGFRIGEISVPTRYSAESSSINFGRCVVYGLGVLCCAFAGFAVRTGLSRKPAFAPKGACVVPAANEGRL